MAILLSTTGVVSTVTINDLGAVDFVHPTVDYPLLDDWVFSEIRNSSDLGAALDAGHISITSDGQVVGTALA